jgi:ElaB/YqjD/DUF883 family membrane-anchored ribosome-binding protein
MSTREQEGNSFARNATRAAAAIEENVHRGADAVSNFARQTAGHVERATDYVQEQAAQFSEKASEKAREHPGYTLLLVGAVGFALGCLARGFRARA